MIDYMLEGFLNFVQKSRIRYNKIFPTTLHLLDHLLFTIGNGYDVIADDIVNMEDESIFKCDEIVDKDAFLESVVEEKLKVYASLNIPRTKEQVIKEVVFFEKLSLDAFSRDALFEELLQYKKSVGDLYHSFSPYTLSEYSLVYKLNTGFRDWFLLIAKNACKASKKALEMRIEENDFELHSVDWWNSKERFLDDIKKYNELIKSLNNMFWKQEE